MRIAAIIATVLGIALAQEAQEAPCPVGYRVVELQCGQGEKAHKLKVALWYPSAGEEKKFDYGGGWVYGRVVPDGAVVGDRHPVAVLSHGFGGSALGWVYLARELVRRGFVVAAADHVDSTNVVRIGKGLIKTKLLRSLREALAIARQGKNFKHEEFSYRRVELRTLIEWLKKQNATEGSFLHNKLDTEGLLLVGHSLGSYTVSAVIGLYKKEPPVVPKAAVLLSGGIWMWNPKEFANGKIPLLIMWGELERWERRRSRLSDLCHLSLSCLRHAGGPRWGVEVAGAGHFDFAYNPRRAKQKAQIHKTIATYINAFVERYILSKEEAEKHLSVPSRFVTLLYPPPEAKYEVETKIALPYGKHPLQKVDIYLPKGAKGFPCVLVIHGGAWVGGKRGMFGMFCKALARRGIGAATCDYRLAPEFVYPAFMEDVAAALVLVRKEFAEAGGDIRRLFVTGHSAGGHISALLATNAKFLKKYGLTPKDIAGVAPVSGVYRIIKNPFKAFGDDPRIWRDASPIDHISKDLPPFLIIYGEKEMLPALTAIRFEKALRDKGVAVNGFMMLGHRHADTARNMNRADSEVFLRLITFFRKHRADKVTPPDVEKPQTAKEER